MNIFALKKRKKFAAALLIICMLTTGCGLFNSQKSNENAYCCFEGCHNKVYKDGMCAMHYLQVLDAENEAERLKLAQENRTMLTATPTPTPTDTPTATPTFTVTPTPTYTPTPTNTPTPTSTPTNTPTPVLSLTPEVFGTPTATPTPDPIKPCNDYVWITTGELNVRKGPGTSYDSIGTLSQGMRVKRTGIDTATEWIRINYYGTSGFISNKYYTTLTPTPSPIPKTLNINGSEFNYTSDLKNAKKGDVVSYGKYEQDNDPDDGKEWIQWFVLDRNDDAALLLSVYVLDTLPFSDGSLEMWNVWENSYIRYWLNNDFYETAFTKEQQDSINTTFLVNDFNYYYEKPMTSKGVSYDANPGIDTYDKIFLLSLDEARQYFDIKVGSYSENGMVYWKSSEKDARIRCTGTEYAFNKGLLIGGNRHVDWLDYNHMYSPTLYGGWWLRSIGKKITSRNFEYNYISSITYKGELFVSGESPDFTAYGVRPVMWVDLKKISSNKEDAPVAVSE